MSIGNIEVVCPMCDNNMEIPGEQKNKRIECSKCGNGFVAYEAVRCEKCGKLRHPHHQCRNCMTKGDREAATGSSIVKKWSDLWAESSRNGELARKQEEAEALKARELFDRLTEDLRAVLEFEAKQNARRCEEMAERIEELEARLSDLEAEIEELKDGE